MGGKKRSPGRKVSKVRRIKNASETLDGMTILICGGAGFIGSNFIHYLLGKYPKVRIINLDKLAYSGNLDNLREVEKDKRYTFVRGDIANPKKTNLNKKELIANKTRDVTRSGYVRSHLWDRLYEIC